MSSIYIGDDKVSPITSIEYLKVQVDQNLNWEEHLLKITKKFIMVLECSGSVKVTSHQKQYK